MSCSCKWLRNEVVKIKDSEKRLVHQTKAQTPKTTPQDADRRNDVHNLSDSDEPRQPDQSKNNTEPQGEAKQQPGPSKSQRPKSNRKRSLSELIRQNQEAYSRFITRKIPKLMRQLGVSSSDESD